MANLLLTSYCNQNCAYCFAKSRVELTCDQGDDSMNLSPEGLERIIQFYKKSQLQRFVVLGGEPTLHPQFEHMIDRILKESEFKTLIIFTNGIMPEHSLSYLSQRQDPRIRLALNLNSPAEYTPDKWNRIGSMLDKLGSITAPGVNITRPGQDYDYLFEVITRYHLIRHIRLGLTQPILGADNVYAHEEDFPAIASDIVDLAAHSYDRRIGFSFDCGFRFCMFTLDQHRDLLRFGVKFHSECSPIIDIGPNLSIWRCFPLMNVHNRNLMEFEMKNQMINYYDDIFKRFLPMGNLEACPQCVYRVNGLCKGGCLARTLAAFHYPQHS